MGESAYDLGAVFDEHVADEFVAKDVAATMATMTAEPFVNHVPTMMGGVGGAAVADFYEKYFIGHWPQDTTITPVSRTVGTDHVVDEMIMSFTHDATVRVSMAPSCPTHRNDSEPLRYSRKVGPPPWEALLPGTGWCLPLRHPSHPRAWGWRAVQSELGDGNLLRDGHRQADWFNPSIAHQYSCSSQAPF
jgi:hypothetical protein